MCKDYLVFSSHGVTCCSVYLYLLMQLEFSHLFNVCVKQFIMIQGSVLCSVDSHSIRLANSGFRHSGTPSHPPFSLPFPSPCSFLPSLPPSLPRKPARETGVVLQALPLGSGTKPYPTCNLVHMSQKEQLCWQ